MGSEMCIRDSGNAVPPESSCASVGCRQALSSLEGTCGRDPASYDSTPNPKNSVDSTRKGSGKNAPNRECYGYRPKRDQKLAAGHPHCSQKLLNATDTIAKASSLRQIIKTSLQGVADLIRGHSRPRVAGWTRSYTWHRRPIGPAIRENPARFTKQEEPDY